MKTVFFLLFCFQAQYVSSQIEESRMCTFLCDFYSQLVKEKTINSGDSIYIISMNDMKVKCNWPIPIRMGMPSNDYSKPFYLICSTVEGGKVSFVADIGYFADTACYEIEMVGFYIFKYKSRKNGLKLKTKKKYYL